MISYSEELRTVFEAVLEAEEVLEKPREELEIKFKSSADGKREDEIVTDVDKEVEKKVKSALKEEFPDHGILTEESEVESTSNGYRWVIDPIDGTAQFIHGRGYYCISIALQKEGETVLGVVSAPEWKGGITTIAVKREGAYLIENTELDKISEPEHIIEKGRKLKVSDREKLKGSLGMAEMGTTSSIEEEMSEIRRSLPSLDLVQPGSAALELVEIAEGNIDFRIDYIKEWDYAAGHLIVEEAGGKTSVKSREIPEISSKIEMTIASNSKIHEKIRKNAGKA